MSLFFILSGLFLGWSLGANDAANIFGTGVKTRMFTFKRAATLASIFVILGSVIGGSGTSFTIVKLGSINAIGGAFTVALCAAIIVTFMTKTGLPVSTTQAIIGGIIGWNLYTGSFIDSKSLRNIILSWFFSPLLTGVISFLLFKLLRRVLKKIKIHLLTIDNMLREGLILTAILGAYTLGANNIANVVGIFIPNFPLADIVVFNIIKIKSYQILLFLGGVSIALGIITYSKKVINTIGGEIFKLSPLSAFVVVLSESIVLFLFSSKNLSRLLGMLNLPKIPLVPVSSSHCVVGGVLGIGFAKGIRGMNFKSVYKIIAGWIFSPLLTMILTFFLLFFVQNVFKVEIQKTITYVINDEYIKKLKNERVDVESIKDIKNKSFNKAYELYFELIKIGIEKRKAKDIVEGAKVENIFIAPEKLEKYILNENLSQEQIKFLSRIKGRNFTYRWEILEVLNNIWKKKEDIWINREYNEGMEKRIEDFINYFKNNS